jgi:cation-transporting ATPase E
MQQFEGLSSSEVNKRKKLGLSNQVIDSYTPSYPRIIVKNIFSIINIVVVPLLVALTAFGLFREVLAFIVFVFINTIVSAADEIRAKRTLDKLKAQFQIKATVIRDGVESEIPVNQIVKGDYIKVSEGENIVADGEIIDSNYLQIDESMLTGESNYLQKEPKDKVLSASFVVTGECIYIAENVGKSNYLNKLGAEATKYQEKKSQLQRDGDKMILFLVVASIAMGALTYASSISLGSTQVQALLSLTTVISLIIPQTLIFLFTLTFTISIIRLYQKGVLIQKGGSIEDLSNIDVICLDKTGTITTNNMKMVDVEYFNIDEATLGVYYNSITKKLVGVNKTQETIGSFFKKYPKQEVTEFDQIPFTSKQKYSQTTAAINGNQYTLTIGAITTLENNIDKKIRKEVIEKLKEHEQKGYRVVLALFSEGLEKELEFVSDKAVIFVIEEEVNPGIGKTLNDFAEQGINVKIISGDSKVAVERILHRLGINNLRVVDLSVTHLNSSVIEKHDVFTRSKPEDKLRIIETLQNTGHKVAMVGDGINDVLALKASDVAISVESGAKVARDVSDIVLLNNDYGKVPEIFFEGENILHNLKISTKLFLNKSFFAILFTLLVALFGYYLPIHPSSTLIFSFLGSSAPSYAVILTRQRVNGKRNFYEDVLHSSIPFAWMMTIIGFLYFKYMHDQNYSYDETNTSLAILVLSLSVVYSIFVLLKSKKLKTFQSLLIFFVLLLVGIYQTLLPIERADLTADKLPILIVPILFGTVAFNYVLYVMGVKRLKNLGLITLAAWVVIAGAFVFPWRSYYNVVRININDILFSVGVGVVLLFAYYMYRALLNIFKR